MGHGRDAGVAVWWGLHVLISCAAHDAGRRRPRVQMRMRLRGSHGAAMGAGSLCAVSAGWLGLA